MESYMWCKKCDRAFLRSEAVERGGELWCAFAPKRIETLTRDPVRSCPGKLSDAEPWEQAREEALRLNSRWPEKPVHGETYRIEIKEWRL
jgi:hypothetical protein